MASKNLPETDLLRKLLKYDPETGRLFWRKRPPELFESPAQASRWNGKNAGRRAFTACNGRCLHGSIFAAHYKAHRVIWKMVHDEEPDVVDHINGDPLDNRLENLRNTSHSENMTNARRPSDNTSGHVGVNSSKGMWQATITRHKRTHFLGRFTSIEEAVRARKAAEASLGFHPNHGRS